MENNVILTILNDSKSLSDAAHRIFGKENYTNREKVKRICLDMGFDWSSHISKINESKRKFCVCCGVEITGKYRSKKKFCSRSCSAKYNNTGKVKSEETKLKISITLMKGIIKDDFICVCLHCGKKFKRWHSSKGLYCSSKCHHNHQYENHIKEWKNGDTNGVTGEFGIASAIRRYMFEKNNNSCEMCGWSVINGYTQKIPLQIHHIDGDCTNNKEENLQLLCPNCHSLTETYGSRNKDSKRKSRHNK